MRALLKEFLTGKRMVIMWGLALEKILRASQRRQVYLGLYTPLVRRVSFLFFGSEAEAEKIPGVYLLNRVYVFGENLY
jgi:hypothetical protein